LRERRSIFDITKFQQARADQLVDELSGAFAFDACRQFNFTIIVLRSRRQNDEFAYR
jgi:hypothetical protein